MVCFNPIFTLDRSCFQSTLNYSNLLPNAIRKEKPQRKKAPVKSLKYLFNG